MTTMRVLLVLLAVGLAPSAAAQSWQLVWSDEFDVPGAPDPANWEHELGGGGWGNQESQAYTNSLDNSRVEGGVLIIEAREESLGSNEYTSARLLTRDRASWTYGRIEARIKLPEGQGIWPAFWMMPQDSPYGGWPTSGEIDVMEYLGHETNRVHGTIHYGGGDIGHRYTGTSYTLASGTFSDEFHTFAVEWEPHEIRWYVDDVLFQTQTTWTSAAGAYPAPFDQPFFLILNVAVGGLWPGYPDATTSFPQRMEVDYVRVYEDADLYPQVTFSGPEDGATVDAGSTIELAASGSEGIEQVEFLQGDGVLAVDTEAPYTAEIAGVVDGCYTLSARATNDAGAATTTESVQVTVGAGCPDASQTPYLMVPTPIPGAVEAEYYDLGGSDIAYRDLTPDNLGAGIRQLEGVDIQPSRDFRGGYDVSALSAREWTTYTVDIAEAGTYRVQARVAGSIGGTIRLSLDGNDLLGDVSIPPTGGDATYATVLRNSMVELPAGRHILRIDFRSGGFVLNRLMFTPVSSTATGEAADQRDVELRVEPNPAVTHTDVSFELAEAGSAEVVVYDAVGREVTRIASGWRPAGQYTVTLDVGTLAPGVYLCTLTASGAVRTARLAVTR